MRACRHWARLQGREKQACSSPAMALASCGPSLQKPENIPASIFSLPVDHNLGEALDADGRMLCLLPKAEILRQGLACRKVAVLALAPDNSLLLAARPGPVFDVTCQNPVSAGMGCEEYAAWLIEESLGMPGRVRPVATLSEGPVTVAIFSALFSSSFLAARADAEFLSSYVAEIGELAQRQLTTPLLHSALTAINPSPA